MRWKCQTEVPPACPLARSQKFWGGPLPVLLHLLCGFASLCLGELNARQMREDAEQQRREGHPAPPTTAGCTCPFGGSAATRVAVELVGGILDDCRCAQDERSARGGSALEHAGGATPRPVVVFGQPAAIRQTCTRGDKKGHRRSIRPRATRIGGWQRLVRKGLPSSRATRQGVYTPLFQFARR